MLVQYKLLANMPPTQTSFIPSTTLAQAPASLARCERKMCMLFGYSQKWREHRSGKKKKSIGEFSLHTQFELLISCKIEMTPIVSDGINFIKLKRVARTKLVESLRSHRSAIVSVPFLVGTIMHQHTRSPRPGRAYCALLLCASRRFLASPPAPARECARFGFVFIELIRYSGRMGKALADDLRLLFMKQLRCESQLETLE